MCFYLEIFAIYDRNLSCIYFIRRDTCDFVANFDIYSRFLWTSFLLFSKINLILVKHFQMNDWIWSRWNWQARTWSFHLERTVFQPIELKPQVKKGCCRKLGFSFIFGWGVILKKGLYYLMIDLQSTPLVIVEGDNYLDVSLVCPKSGCNYK